MVAAGQVSKHKCFSVSHIFSVATVRCACQVPLVECTVRDVLMHLDGRAAPGHVSA